MKGLYALLAILCFFEAAYSQTVTKYRNPWVELVRQISCRSVTCNFQETCDLQVVCTPFGDCGQRATCLQIPFPRNTVCPDPFTNAGPPYTVECFDDAGCQEPMVCCHSYAKSYCHMPPFSSSNGNTANGNGNAPPPNTIVVEPVSESALMNQGTNRNTGNTGNTRNTRNSNSRNSNPNVNGNAAAAASGSSNRGSRSVIVARSDFFDPTGSRRRQRLNWQNSVQQRRRQQLNSLNTSIRTVGEGRSGIRRIAESLADDGVRASIRRNQNGGRVTVEISGQVPGGSEGTGTVVDVNGIRITGNGRTRAVSRTTDGNELSTDETTNGIQPTGNDVRMPVSQNDIGVPAQGLPVTNNGRMEIQTNAVQNAQAPMEMGAQATMGSQPVPSNSMGNGTPGAQAMNNNAQGMPGSQVTQGPAVQTMTGTGTRPANARAGVGGPAFRVNVHGGTGVRPLIRKVDLWKGHGFYGERRRVLGNVQYDSFGGFPNRFRGPIPNTQRIG